MGKNLTTTGGIILVTLIEDYYKQGLSALDVQERLHMVFDKYEVEYKPEHDPYLDYADALYANIDRNKGSYNYEEYPFAEKRNPETLSQIVTTFDNLREHRKEDAPDKKDEWTGYGFLELPEEEKREAWAMYIRRGAPDGEEFGYFDRLIHGLMYPSESRLTKETNSLDELEDFWVNHCECQLKKMMGSKTFNLLGDMLYECVLRLDLEHFAFNLLKARKLLYNWAVESEKHTEF